MLQMTVKFHGNGPDAPPAQLGQGDGIGLDVQKSQVLPSTQGLKLLAEIGFEIHQVRQLNAFKCHAPLAHQSGDHTASKQIIAAQGISSLDGKFSAGQCLLVCRNFLEVLHIQVPYPANG